MGAIKDLNYLETETALSLYCRAIAHPARVKILTELFVQKNELRNIDMTRWLSLSRATVKNHIDIMKDAGILRIKYYPHHYEVSLNSKGKRFAEMVLLGSKLANLLPSSNIATNNNLTTNNLTLTHNSKKSP